MLLWIVGTTAGLIFVIRFAYNLQSGRCKSTAKLNGKTAIVTGASAGIGKETARDLAERGARVILACRNLNKAQKVADDIISSSGNKQVVVRELDLSSLASVRKFAKQILSTESALHILINNAGRGGCRTKQLTIDGLEMTMATNHYGHFLLTNMLLGLLKASGRSRIINVSSRYYAFCKSLDTNDPYYEKGPFPDGMLLYSHSKLANILFTHELAEKLRGTGVTANSLHPGLVNTEILTKNEPGTIHYIYRSLFWMMGKDEKLGAQTSIYLAVSEEVEKVSGEYFVDCKVAQKSDLAKDPGLAKKFWETSEQVVKLAPEERHF